LVHLGWLRLGARVVRAGADWPLDAARPGGLPPRPGRSFIRPAIQVSATPKWPSGWCWARARFAKSVRWPSQMVTGLPGPLRRHSAPIAE